MRARPPESLAGVSGTLVSGYFATHHLDADFPGQLGEDTRLPARQRLADWRRRTGTRLGPASSLTALARTGAQPLFATLGFDLRESAAAGMDRTLPCVASGQGVEVPVLVLPWGDGMDRHWTEVARLASDRKGDWAVCFNGPALRLCDARHAWARTFLEFDIEATAGAPASFALFWALLRPVALSGLARRLADQSAKHGVAVCTSLRDGVREALGLLATALGLAYRQRTLRLDRTPLADEFFDQALTIIYRVLFLLFAESRALVPVWHPVYRSSYTIESLRAQAQRPGRPAGIWEGLQALSRLAHAGCRAGSLSVTPFNGRLFSPARAPLADGLRLDDGLVAKAIVALTTHQSPHGREPISFRDLGVEQLGAVYESVLDYEPRIVPAHRTQVGPGRSARRTNGIQVELVAGRGRRKSSGTFYTPRLITDEIVRHTLTPLVSGRSPDEILQLRVVDPAMGSGAFLVSACRFLAAAYEDAVVRDGGRLAADITAAERAEFRRWVARRCLYGVDVNPMAVQVARLSLWLATLASDRPLTFLDHHLAVGDSLVGASLDDLARQPPGAARNRRPAGHLPLFDTAGSDASLGRALPMRLRLEAAADDTVEAVRQKERLVADLGSETAPLAMLKRAADLWCATWFWEDGDSRGPDAREYADLAAALMGARPALPARVVQSRLAAVSRIAAERRFLHWTLEFPEVFYGSNGVPLPSPGFDAILGNPPWEMLRGDLGDEDERTGRRDASARLTRFARESGVYPSCARGHANQFQLFVERSLDLVRAGGRVGLIVPWGLASDHGCAALRERLFERCNTDRLIGFENTAALFPIHRSIRFLLLSTTKGGRTRRTRCRFGLRNASDLGATPGARAQNPQRTRPVVLTRDMRRRVAGPDLALPHVRSVQELRLLDQLASRFPPLSDAAGWNATFGRELNATDDREWFTDVPGQVPVVDGKHVDPFVVKLGACRRWIRDPAAFALTRAGRAAADARLAYRDVASATNRLTLIAAILPPRAAAVHTLFCLKAPPPVRTQRVLCALLNSLVANFLVRAWVTTHLGSTTVERLPAPRPSDDSRAWAELASLAHRLERPGQAFGQAYVELQARMLHMYGLTCAEATLVLETFPLLGEDLRTRVRRAFERNG